MGSKTSAAQDAIRCLTAAVVRWPKIKNNEEPKRLRNSEKIRANGLLKTKNANMTNSLKRHQGMGTSTRVTRRSKDWSPERRARQAALIRGWQPWRRSTGPRTEAGKVRCAMNALKHGFRSCTTIREYQRIRYAIRLAASNNERLRAFIRNRNARPRIRIKPGYVKLWLARHSGLPRKSVGGLALRGAKREGGSPSETARLRSSP